MKIAIIDKDGTLTETVSGATFVQSPTDQKLIDGVQPALAKLLSEGYTLAIASNQAGVEAGHKTLEDAIAEMQYAMKLINIQYHGLFCPDMAGNECYIVSDFSAPPLHKVERYKHLIGQFRKPNAGMLLALRQLFEIDGDGCECIMIGDSEKYDKGAADAAQIPFIHAKDWWIR